MRVKLLIRVWLVALGVMAGLSFLGQNLAHSQTMNEYQVKAAYLYSFAKFIEWPARAFSSPAAPLRFCVLNDQVFMGELNHIVEGKVIGGRRVEVIPVRNAEESVGCHLLFIDSSHARRAQHILEILRDTSVVTVGDAPGFIEEGGIIDFVLHDDRVQFRVNHKAATQAGLQVSSHLLGVAKLVIE